MTEAQARAFWDTHAITEEYLASAPHASEDEFPPVRPDTPYGRPQLSAAVMRRLRRVAWQRGVNVDVLMQELLEQALATEEGRMRATGA